MMSSVLGKLATSRDGMSNPRSFRCVLKKGVVEITHLPTGRCRQVPVETYQGLANAGVLPKLTLR